MNEEIVKISTEEANSKEKKHDVKTKVTSKNGNFTLNEKASIQKKIKSCKDQIHEREAYQMTEKGTNRQREIKYDKYSQ